jgi:hypothetical protein
MDCGIHCDGAKLARGMPEMSTVLKVIGAAGVVALSFWITLTILKMRQPDASDASIAVVEATYGRNCGGSAALGNVTKKVAEECNGRSGKCELMVGPSKFGDTAPGCPKDFVVQWRCGHSVAVQTAQLAAEASGKSITLECPAK